MARRSLGRTLLAGLALSCLVLGTVACHRQATPPSAGGSAPHEAVAPSTDSPHPSEPRTPPDFAVDAASTRDGKAFWYDVPENSLPERRAWASEMTAASDVLPLNTYVRVHRLEDGDPNKSVIVRITDNGVHKKNTLVDLNREAAEALGMIKSGEVRVRLEVLTLKNADTNKPVEAKEAPNGPKLDRPAATKDDEKQAAKVKTGE